MHEMLSADSAVRAFCTFRAQGRLYGIDLSHLREISTAATITPVPQAPRGVRGLANLRSRIHLILDLRSLLGLQSSDCTPDSRLIIFKARVVEDLGVLVDSGGDIVRVAEAQIEAHGDVAAVVRDPSDNPTTRLVVGVCKLETELMMIIDPTRFADAVARALD